MGNVHVSRLVVERSLEGGRDRLVMWCVGNVLRKVWMRLYMFQLIVIWEETV